jgi:uncharacterized membrane protein YedE/YeeE
MQIDWSHFTPGASFAGGLLIGLAAALFVLLKGRVLGVSGIVGGVLRPVAGDTAWRFAFLIGLFAAPWVWRAIAGTTAPLRIDAGWIAIVTAGLLVGIGTRYGGGCTSGHGVCGIARLSPRSLVATCVFMFAGFGTVLLLRHVLV